MTVPEFKDNLLRGVSAYKNDLPYNFPVLGIGKMVWGYNSNSYVGGMLQYATGSSYPSIGREIRNSGYIVPGFEKPIPVGGR
jgi:hypothetical protein